MKEILLVIVLFFLVLIPLSSAQVGDVNKTSLLDGKKWAYSLDFDDSRITTYENVPPILSKYNYSAELGVITGPASDPENGYHMIWTQIVDLFSIGWDIASHSVNHLFATGASQDQINYEMNQSKIDIENNIVNYTATDYIYPYGDIAPAAVSTASEYYLSAEAEQNDNLLLSIDPWNADDFKINRHSAYGNMSVYDSRFDSVSAASQNGRYWLIEYSHGIEPNATDIYDSTSESLDAHMNYLYTHYGKKGSDEVWVAPTRVVHDYLLSREKSIIQNKQVNGSAVSFYINQSNLPAETMYRKITLVTEINSSWKNISVTQAGKTIPYILNGNTLQTNVGEGQLVIKNSQDLQVQATIQKDKSAIGNNDAIKINWSCSADCTFRTTYNGSIFYSSNLSSGSISFSNLSYGDYYLSVVSGNKTLASDSFSVVNTSPYANINLSATTIPWNGKINISWQASGLNSSTYFVLINPLKQINFSSNSSGSKQFDALQLYYAGNYTAVLNLTSPYGNLSKSAVFSVSKWAQKNDTTIPIIMISQSATTIPWNGNISVSWNMVDNAGLASSNFYIINPMWKKVYPSNASSGKLSMKATDLYYAGDYYIVASAVDLSGNKANLNSTFNITPWKRV